MNSKYQYLSKNIGLFMLAVFLPKALDFIMMPLYTRYLSSADYGTVDLLSNTVQLLLPFLTLQVQDAVLRYAMDKNYEPRNVLSVGIRITLCGGILLTVGVLFCGVFDLFQIEVVYLVYVWVNYFTGALNNIFSYFCRGINRVDTVTYGSGINASLIVISNLLFLCVLHWGLYGYLLASTIGALSCCLFQFFHAKLYRYISFEKIPRDVFSGMIAMSIPMIFSALSWWANNASDKYILTFFDGVAVVGIYAAAYKIPTVLSMLSNIISKAFSISAIKEFDKDDSDGFIGNTYSILSFLMTLCCSGIMIINVPVSRLLFSDEFFVAWRYVPILLLSVLFNQLSLVCENIFLAVRQTKMISATAVAGALINTVLNFVLIPFCSAYGAAVATAVGFGAVWALRYITLHRYIALKDCPSREFPSYVLLFIQVVLACFGMKFFVFQIAIFVFLLYLYRSYLIKIWKMIRKTVLKK